MTVALLLLVRPEERRGPASKFPGNCPKALDSQGHSSTYMPLPWAQAVCQDHAPEGPRLHALPALGHRSISLAATGEPCQTSGTVIPKNPALES